MIYFRLDFDLLIGYISLDLIFTLHQFQIYASPISDVVKRVHLFKLNLKSVLVITKLIMCIIFKTKYRSAISPILIIKLFVIYTSNVYFRAGSNEFIQNSVKSSDGPNEHFVRKVRHCELYGLKGDHHSSILISSIT